MEFGLKKAKKRTQRLWKIKSEWRSCSIRWLLVQSHLAGLHERKVSQPGDPCLTFVLFGLFIFSGFRLIWSPAKLLCQCPRSFISAPTAQLEREQWSGPILIWATRDVSKKTFIKVSLDTCLVAVMQQRPLVRSESRDNEGATEALWACW